MLEHGLNFLLEHDRAHHYTEATTSCAYRSPTDLFCVIQFPEPSLNSIAKASFADMRSRGLI